MKKLFHHYFVITLLLVSAHVLYAENVSTSEFKKIEESSATKEFKNAYEYLQSEGVAFVEFLFSDVNGKLKKVIKSVETILDDQVYGIAIDGSSVKALNSIEESGCIVMPDMQTLRLNPFSTNNKTAVIFGSVYDFNGQYHSNDPRALLEKFSYECYSKGYRLLAGAEIEFFLFVYDKNQNSLLTVDSDGYCDNVPVTQLKAFEEDLLSALTVANMNYEKMHHEVAPGQYEVVLGYSDALDLADRIVYTQFIIKMVAHKHNMIAKFMPKPIAGINGSGMHIHASVQKHADESNLFFDIEGEYFLSHEGRQFISGILAHAREMNLLFNSSPNSFKRLIPGYEAPFYLCAGNENRSAAIRIPQVSNINIAQHNGSAVRIELRWPDSTCNPYLALYSLFAAGIKGIEDNLPENTFVDTNLYHATDEQLASYNIEKLPADFAESIACVENSEFVKELLGTELHKLLIEEKKNILNTYLEKVGVHDPLVISGYELFKGI